MKQLSNYLILFFCLSLAACPLSQNSSDKEEKPIAIEGTAYDSESYLESSNRAIWQKPEFVINFLGDLENKVIADIGAGTGYFAFRFLFHADKVIAIDIDEKSINLMNLFAQNMPEEFKDKFETRLALPDDPLLNDDEVDLVVIINTIAFISNRTTYLEKLRKSMRDDGRIMIMDFKMKNIPIESAPPKEDRVHASEIENDLIDAGFTNILLDDTSLAYQYLILANKSVEETQ